MLRVGGGKWVNKNEFTRIQSSYIYNNYGHKAFTWSLQIDDKFLKDHQWKMFAMVVYSMACLKYTYHNGKAISPNESIYQTLA